MYNTGPTSAVALRDWAASGARSACMATMFFCAVEMSDCNDARSDNWLLRSCAALVAPLSSVVRPSSWSTCASICCRAFLFASILLCSVDIFSSNICNCAVISPAGTDCDRCAALRYPKIPIEVISINTTIAGTRYSLNCKVALSQYLCSQTVAVIFETSSVPPMMIIAHTDPGNIAINPVTEYTAATPDNSSAVNKIIIANIIRSSSPHFTYVYSIFLSKNRNPIWLVQDGDSQHGVTGINFVRSL